MLDYSKYKYEQEQKAKAARKHQQQVNVREIKLRPKIAQHDYETKRGHVERFLKQQDKVKVTIMFRGREQSHPERGRALLDRLLQDVSEIATIEQEPLQEGRNMTMLLAPTRTAGQEKQAAAGSAAPPLGTAPPSRVAAAATPAEHPGSLCFNSRPDAEDEDPFGREEALPQDRQGQAARPARLLEPHPREEVAEAQAAHGAARR